MTEEKTTPVKLNAWELLAIEKALEDFQQTEQLHYTSIEQLIQKIHEAVIE